MVKINLETLQEEVVNLKKEIYEIKQIITMGPELSEETAIEIETARKKMETEWVAHQDIVKEFVKHVRD